MSVTALDRARAGDERAFHELVAAHTAELRVHCYRMLGSPDDADDLLQETLTSAWRGLPGFAGRSSLRAWLYAIATNRCLNAIRAAKRRPPAEPVPPFDPPPPSRRGEVTWLGPYPDAWLPHDDAPGPAARYAARESVELAFVAALQLLPARQTAALLLCDVLGYATAEAAAMLATTPAAVKGALQRARAALDRGRTDRPARPGSAAERTLARRFADAFSADDIDGVLALLTDDAWLAMPPAPHEYHGTAAIGGFLRASAAWRGRRRMRLVPTTANTQPAYGCFIVDPAGHDAMVPAGMLVLTASGERIGAITRFLDGDLPGVFGLTPPGA